MVHPDSFCLLFLPCNFFIFLISNIDPFSGFSGGPPPMGGPPAPPPPPSAAGLFGGGMNAGPPAMGNSLFGNSTGGMFGASNTGGGMFGGGNQNQQIAGGLFGNGGNNSQQKSGGLFSSKPQNKPSPYSVEEKPASSGLFGSKTTTKSQGMLICAGYKKRYHKNYPNYLF